MPDQTNDDATTVRNFFGKYGAVPANDKGIDWPACTTDGLIYWLREDAKALRLPGMDGNARRIVERRFQAAASEAWKRVCVIGERCHEMPADWPERNELAKLVACLGCEVRELVRLAIA
jgi:hypothetical protein